MLLPLSKIHLAGNEKGKREFACCRLVDGIPPCTSFEGSLMNGSVHVSRSLQQQISVESVTLGDLCK